MLKRKCYLDYFLYLLQIYIKTERYKMVGIKKEKVMNLPFCIFLSYYIFIINLKNKYK